MLTLLVSSAGESGLISRNMNLRNINWDFLFKTKKEKKNKKKAKQNKVITSDDENSKKD